MTKRDAACGPLSGQDTLICWSDDDRMQRPAGPLTGAFRVETLLVVVYLGAMCLGFIH